MAIPWVLPGGDFPPTARALDDPNGLLAAGADLRPETLLRAYRRGIFPWYEEGQPILWWSPNPRLVLQTANIRVTRRFARFLRNTPWTYSIDQCFRAVMEGCAAPRPGQSGTWITPAMLKAYEALHGLGHAHSLEVFDNGRLIGGIYGVHLGGIFFGESMFSRCTNASRAALTLLASLGQRWGIELIDCQVESAHLRSLGAECWPRERFEDALVRLTGRSVACPWSQPPAPLAHYRQHYRLNL